jgi:hypothetical protein
MDTRDHDMEIARERGVIVIRRNPSPDVEQRVSFPDGSVCERMANDLPTGPLVARIMWRYTDGDTMAKQWAEAEQQRAERASVAFRASMDATLAAEPWEALQRLADSRRPIPGEALGLGPDSGGWVITGMRALDHAGMTVTPTGDASEDPKLAIMAADERIREAFARMSIPVSHETVAAFLEGWAARTASERPAPVLLASDVRLAAWPEHPIQTNGYRVEIDPSRDTVGELLDHLAHEPATAETAQAFAEAVAKSRETP